MIVSGRCHERVSRFFTEVRQAFSFFRPTRTEVPNPFPATWKWWESPLLHACDRLKDEMAVVRSGERRVG